MDILTVQRPEALEPVLRGFLRKRERVLLCFPPHTGLNELFSDMVRGCGGVSFCWTGDHRWKALLRLAFSEYCTVVIGPPSVVLGLSKLAKRMGTPLPVRNCLLVGDTPDQWMLETICHGLDCRIPGCCVGKEQPEEGPMTELARELRRWTSILDFRLTRGSGGLSLEMVVFPGEKLPKMPSFGKLQIREWNPDQDEPFEVG